MTNAFLPRRIVMATTLAAMALGFAAKAQAADAVTMFKVISPRDEIFVGVPAAELAAMGQGAPAEAIARKVAADGQLSLWQYSVQRGATGALVMAPVARVGVFAAGIVRIEPFTPVHPVVAPN